MPGTAPATLRVSVCADDRRVDLVVPVGVPVADLVPDLACDLGLVDAAFAHQRLRLATTTGAWLRDDLGLAAQGVGDGQLLSLVGETDVMPERYDDLAEAMAVVVARDVPGWDPVVARWTWRVLGALLTALGAVALVVAHAHEALVDAATGLTVVMALVTVVGAAAPAAALAVTGLQPDVPVDVDRLADDAASAHRVLVVLTFIVGLAPGLAAPLAVGTGSAGSAITLVCALLVLLRTRRFLSHAVVLAGLTTGIASLLSVAGSVLFLQAEWRTEVALSLLLTGAVAAVVPVGSTRVRRIGDALETACLVAVPPLLVLVVGLPARLPG